MASGTTVNMLLRSVALGSLMVLSLGCRSSTTRPRIAPGVSAVAVNEQVEKETVEAREGENPADKPRALPKLDPDLATLLRRPWPRGADVLGEGTTAKLSTLAFSSYKAATRASDDDASQYDVDVLERKGDLVRVRINIGLSVLVGWIPARDLAPRFVIRRSPLLEGAGAEPKTHQVEVLPGVVVDILEEQGDWLRVHAELEGPCRSPLGEAEGWLPRSAVGAIYKTVSPKLESDGQVENATTITGQRPRHILARLHPDYGTVYARSHGKIRGGRQEVSANLGNAIVRGFVPARSFP